MQVDLIDVMGNDDSVVNAARVSFSKDASQFTSEQNAKLIRFLINHGHFSPLTHPQLSFRINAPIFVARQLYRHTIGLTINEESRRYIDATPSIYTIEQWRKRPDKSIKQGSGEDLSVVENRNVVNSVAKFNRYALELYEYLIQGGVAPEQARSVLPLGTMTQWIWTGSLWAFLRICCLRIKPDAQGETRQIALQIAQHIKSKFPVTFEIWAKINKIPLDKL